jgi:lipid A 3-O-deacylase
MRRELASALVCTCAAFPVSGADGVSASFGQGARNNVLDAYRVAVQWTWQRSWLASAPVHLSGYWDLSVAMFENDADPPPGDDSEERVYALAFAPTFRFQTDPIGAVTPFVDVAIGVAGLSETELRTGDSPRELGGHFQFEDRVTIGARLGANAEIAFQRMHYSNLGFGGENDGIDTHLLTLAWHF